MSTLAALLRYLGRGDIAEVRLQSDTAAAAALVAGGYTPLTKVPLSTAQIVQIVDGTSIAGVLAHLTDDSEQSVALQLADLHYSVRMVRHQGRLQVRFAKAEDGLPGTLAHASAQLKARAQPGEPPRAEHADGTASPAGTLDSGWSQASAQHGAMLAPKAPSKFGADINPAQQRAARHMLGQILASARQQGASDVHITADRSVRVRKHAELVEEGPPMPAAEVNGMLGAILTSEQASALETLGYADLALDLPQAGRLRVNICRQTTGLKACFRLVSGMVPTLASLGLPKELEAVTTYHQGLAIISGPNGQGKTTTLAAIVNLINTNTPHHIITVEDPVEVLHPVRRAVMSQREVGTHTRSFTRALKASLREDPDVIVIGELRDRETVEIALQAAETGHLVIATMSTRSAAKTIDRLIDLFPPDDQPQVRATLAGALKIIVSQRLVPSLDGGMIAAAELITGSVPLWSLIRDNKLFQLPSLQQRGRSLGMIKFDTSLQELVAVRKISLDVAKKYAENLAEFERSLAAAATAAISIKGA